MSSEEFDVMWTLFVVVLILKVIQKLQFPSSIPFEFVVFVY